MFLTDDQLNQLTDLKRPKDQIRWLRANEFKYMIGASGRPKVLRSEVEIQMSTCRPDQPSSQPDFSSIN